MPFSSPRGRAAGFTLIELMVGIVVSLIGTLAIMAAFAVFEGQKRTTTSGDDAQQSGSYALYALERQIRTAGSGLVQGNRYGVWGCPIAARTAGGGSMPLTLTSPAFSKWPSTTRAVSVLIASGGTNAAGVVQPDIIGIVSGSPAGTVFKAPVLTATAASSITLTNSFGITSGDYLLGPVVGGNCALALTTGNIPAPTKATPNPAISIDTNNSPATGLVGATNVFDMGPDPIISLYTVDTNAGSTFNSLVTFDMLQRQVNGAAAAVTPIADGIVMMKALYGIHTCGTCDANSIDSWVAPTTSPWDIATINATSTTAYNAMVAIKAVRVAIVAQSRISQRSQDYVGKAALTLFSDLPAALQVTVTTDSSYRYKVYDTTIPMRNALITKYF